MFFQNSRNVIDQLFTPFGGEVTGRNGGRVGRRLDAPYSLLYVFAVLFFVFIFVFLLFVSSYLLGDRCVGPVRITWGESMGL